MKEKKSAGIDGISAKTWTYGEIVIRKGLVDIIRQTWKEEEIPEKWKTSVIVPTYKKGDQERTEN